MQDSEKTPNIFSWQSVQDDQEPDTDYSQAYRAGFEAGFEAAKKFYAEKKENDEGGTRFLKEDRYDVV